MDAEEIKQQLGERAKDIIANGLNFHISQSGMVKCPLHNDKKPSMSWFKNGLMWRCHACGEQIDIYRYYTEFERMSFVEAKNKVAEMVGVSIEKPIKVIKQEYALPKVKVEELSEKAIEYMNKRKISKQTLDDWNVKQGKFTGKDVYVFQYFDKDILKFVSYREIGKGGLKGGCEPNTESILWGMWHIDKTKPVIITEGQPDAMAIWESGYKNVVSVPGGASNLKWIDNCWEWLKGINEIIVWADNDAPGFKMAKELENRFNNVKIIFSEKRKDANEVLFYEGPGKVIELIEKGIKKIPDGLLDLAEMEYVSLIDKQNGGIETGFVEYDRHVEDWKEEELTVVFGRNGEGKTTFISQVIAHCLEKNVKVFLYSGEMSDFKIQDWLYKQLAGNKPEYLRTIQCKYKDKTEVKPEIVTQIKQWHQGKLFLFDRKVERVAKDTEKFFDLMTLAAHRYGVKLFIIDNLMSKLEENADSLYSDQANFVQRCKEFAIINKVHIVVLAHPNKTKGEIKESETGNLDKTDISGSNNIPNKADNIISVERNWGENAEYDAIITSLKDRESGERKIMKFMFSKKTLRFYNDFTRENIKYDWEKGSSKILGLEEVYDGEQCPF